MRERLLYIHFYYYHDYTAASVTCAVEGNVQIDLEDDGEGESYNGLLQVCLFGQWTYVCNVGFDGTDLNVALHQLGYTAGGVCILILFDFHAN